MTWELKARGQLWGGKRPWIMGVVNITPDSFSDGGRFLAPAQAVERALKLVDEGADILDLGAESTRPGSTSVPPEVQLDRLIPVIRMLRRQISVPLSVDTSSPQVMRAVIDDGVSMINDIHALQGDGALALVAESGVACCLMHMQGIPSTMQRTPEYQDVVRDVFAFLQRRMHDCSAAGVDTASVCVDPGFGFGKLLEHNLTLMRQLKQFSTLAPVLVGVSRKSMLGELLGNRPVQERISAGLAMAIWAMEQGAALVRTHDVQATLDAMRVWESLRSGA